MTLVRCLYTGFPGELEDPATGRTIPLVPNETIIELDQAVADASPLFWPVDQDGNPVTGKRAKTPKPAQDGDG